MSDLAGSKTSGGLALCQEILIRSKGWWPRGKKKALKRALQIMEAGVGIEPAYTVLQTAA